MLVLHLPRPRLRARAYPAEQSNKAGIGPDAAMLEANKTESEISACRTERILLHGEGSREPCTSLLEHIPVATCEPWAYADGQRRIRVGWTGGSETTDNFGSSYRWMMMIPGSCGVG
ncbi:unnamed protein product [Tuber aestivum]|uniref:Uncharacterized protein n=1 Tax=Tuber aestivum TaxID=59557 RepID=A0A292PX12_9PEZI|nr:unnamed protein product [Tuber aestivum]